MEQEELFASSLDLYSKQMESKINSIISFRNTFTSIESYAHFLKEKSHIMQGLFEIEDILRNSCLFLRKNYFKLKQSLMIDSLSKEYDIENNYQYPDPLTFKGVDADNNHSIQQEEEKENKRTCLLMNNEAHSLETISYHLSTEKDDDTIHCSENLNGKQDNGIIILNEANNHNVLNQQINKQQQIVNNLSNEKQQQEQQMLYCSDNLSLSSLRGDKDDTFIKTYKKNDIPSSDNDYNSLINQSKPKNPFLLPIKETIKQRKNLSMIEPSCINQIPLYKDLKLNSNEKPNKLYDIDYDAIIQNADCLYDSSTNKKNASLVADIIMKINSNNDLFQMLITLFNDSLINDLMEVPPNEKLIEAVNKSIKEIERLQGEDKLKEEAHKIIEKHPINLSYNNYQSRPPHASYSNNLNSSSAIGSHQRKKKRNNTPSLQLMNSQYNTKGLNNSDGLHQTMAKKTTYADDLLANNGFTNQQQQKKKNKKDQQKRTLIKVGHSMVNGEKSVLSMTMKNMIPIPMYTSINNHNNNNDNSTTINTIIPSYDSNNKFKKNNKNYRTIQHSSGYSSLKSTKTYKIIKDTRFRSIC